MSRQVFTNVLEVFKNFHFCTMSTTPEHLKMRFFFKRKQISVGEVIEYLNI